MESNGTERSKRRKVALEVMGERPVINYSIDPQTQKVQETLGRSVVAMNDVENFVLPAFIASWIMELACVIFL